MQFRVPQFLDIEDKVFGPFTFKQFGYLLGAIGFAYIFWKLIPTVVISFPLIIVFSGTFIALAFVKVNNRPFADVLESAYKFVIGDKVFVWQKKQEKRDILEIQKQNELQKNINTEKVQIKSITPEKIKELSRNLDILENSNNAISNNFDNQKIFTKNSELNINNLSIRDQLLKNKKK